MKIHEINDPLTLACVLLERGKHGPDQPHGVKGRLAEMERVGLASYSEKGWRLTEKGERVSRDLLKAARRFKRTGRVET